MDYVKNALIFSVMIFVLVAYVGMVIGGAIHFWFWATNGAWFGFVLACATVIALVGGPLFAAWEATKR